MTDIRTVPCSRSARPTGCLPTGTAPATAREGVRASTEADGRTAPSHARGDQHRSQATQSERNASSWAPTRSGSGA